MEIAIFRKAQELSFALLRVAAHVRRFELRQTLERLSYHLLENISYQNQEMTIRTIDALRNFVQLGKNIYEIETLNAKILDRELEHLGNQIRKISGLGGIHDLETLFTKEVTVKNQESGIRNKEEEKEYGNEETGNEETEVILDTETGTRKQRIIDIISSSTDKRLSLKEIVAAFPEVSSRTIRNDLKRLFEEGKVMRQGPGGPASYYELSTGVINP